jgi:hypothetical protein
LLDQAAVLRSVPVRGGRFLDDDPGELIDFVDRKVLHRGIAARLGRVEGVQIRAAIGDLGRAERKAARTALPHLALYKARLTRRHPSLYLWSGSLVARDEVPARLAAAGVAVPTKPTSGGLELELAEGATAPEIVDLALAVLRALGTAGGPGWEWEPIIETDTSSID